MVIGVTDEDVTVVDMWIKKAKPGYPIVAVKSRAISELLGVKTLPHKGVVDPKGILTYTGKSESSALKDALKSAKPGPLWPKKLEKVTDAFQEGKLGRAWSALQAVQQEGKLDEREQQLVTRFSAQIEKGSTELVEKAKKAAAAGRIGEAWNTIEGLPDAAPPLPASADAKKLADELKATPRFEDELKGGEAFVPAEAHERAQEYVEAVEAYKALIKKFAGTKIADAARERASTLISLGMPGYSPGCKRCSTKGTACDKHLKVLKL